MRRFGTVLSFQPILLGLIFLTRQFWIEGGVLIGSGLFVIVFVESYTSWKTRLPGRKILSPITRNSLETFANGAGRYFENDTGTANDSSPPGTRTRGSMASVLEMMSTTLAVTPSSSNFTGVVPLRMFFLPVCRVCVDIHFTNVETETLDDLTATERAARTHPDAPPTRKTWLAYCMHPNLSLRHLSSGYRLIQLVFRVMKPMIFKSITIFR